MPFASAIPCPVLTRHMLLPGGTGAADPRTYASRFASPTKDRPLPSRVPRFMRCGRHATSFTDLRSAAGRYFEATCAIHRLHCPSERTGSSQLLFCFLKIGAHAPTMSGADLVVRSPGVISRCPRSRLPRDARRAGEHNPVCGYLSTLVLCEVRY